MPFSPPPAQSTSPKASPFLPLAPRSCLSSHNPVSSILLHVANPRRISPLSQGFPFRERGGCFACNASKLKSNPLPEFACSEDARVAVQCSAGQGRAGKAGGARLCIPWGAGPLVYCSLSSCFFVCFLNLHPGPVLDTGFWTCGYR